MLSQLVHCIISDTLSSLFLSNMAGCYRLCIRTDLPVAESDEFGVDKEPVAMAIRHPVVGAQRWFDGQGEFSAFVVYTWLAVASASLVIVIILVRYRHEVRHEASTKILLRLSAMVSLISQYPQ